MNYKLKAVLLCITFIFALILSASTAIQTLSTVSATELPENSNSKYYIKLENQSLTVYQGEKVLLTNIKIPELREQDRLLLEDGIWVSSYNDILKLIEDFTS